MIRLENYDGNLYAGTEFHGTVQAIYDKEGFQIPEDCIGAWPVIMGDTDGVASLKEGENV